MRNLYIILSVIIAALSAMTSCHREEIPCDDSSVKDGMPIEFSSVSVTIDTKTETEGSTEDETESSTSTIPINNFRVWASLTVNNQTQYGIFGDTGTSVSKSINGQTLSWVYSPLRYWRPGDYKFYAVSPASHAAGQLTGNGLNLTFQDWDLSANQVDLLLATSTTSNDVVSLQFNHLLSKISFSAKNVSQKPTIITSVKIKGNHTKASTMTYKTDLSWNLSSGSNSNIQNLPLKTETSITATTDSYTQLTQDNGILVFPENCNLLVELTIKQDANSQGYTKNATIPTTNWVAGNHYEYKINIGPDNIAFSDISVVTWQKKDNDGNDYIVDDEIEF